MRFSDILSRADDANPANAAWYAGVAAAAAAQCGQGRAADGLELLRAAWACYEDEQPDGAVRSRAQQTRSDWGSMARRFLERED